MSLHVTSEPERPSHVRVFEMYVDEAAYRAHLETVHFKRFVTATQAVVTDRRLCTALPIRVDSKPLAGPHLMCV